MDAGRFWLVDIVATTRTRIRLVTDGPSAIRARYNTHPHNMSFDQVVVQLHECFEDGLILADQMDLTVANMPQGVIVREGLRLDLDDMMRLRNDPSLDFEYFLTKEGGAQWESFATPEWPCFYEDDYDEVEGSTVITIECASFERLRDLVDGFDAVWDFGPWSEKESERLVPWDATYWKTLPQGLRCSFRVCEKECYDEARLRKLCDNCVWCQRGFSLATCRELVRFS